MENYCDRPENACSCGRILSDHPQPYSWEDHGYCDLPCALQSSDALTLFGNAAVEMARHGNRHFGPGFEGDLIRDWLSAARPEAPAMLRRISANHDRIPGGSPDSWMWRLNAGGQCMFGRCTKKA